MAYKRTVEHTITADHWVVDMGRLDYLNGPASYVFPSQKAAELFAKCHQERFPDRKIYVNKEAV